MCKGSQTTTTSSAPSAQGQAILSDVAAGAQNTAAANPYVPYTGEIAAPQNAQQNALDTDIFNDNQIATPYYYQGSGDVQSGVGTVQQGVGALGNASGIVGQGVGALGGDAALTEAGAGAVNPDQFNAAAVNQYLSPYTSDVVNTTQGQFNLQNQQNENSLLSQGIQSGNAFGGDRAGVAESQLAGQEETAQAPVIAGLENAGYTQALGEFNTQQGVNLSADQANQARLLQAGSQLGAVANTAGSLANTETGVGTAAGTLGTETGNLGTSEAGLGQSLQTGQIAANTAALTAAGQAQATQQAQDTAAYQQYQTGEAFPYAQDSWLAGIDTAAATGMGGTSSTTGPPPSLAGSLIGGAATLGGAALLAPVGTFAATGGRINGTKGLGKSEPCRKGLASGGPALFGGVPWLTPGAITSGRGVGIPNPPSMPSQPAANISGGAGILGKGIQKSGQATQDAADDLQADIATGDAIPQSTADASASMSGLYADGGPVLGLKKNLTSAQIAAANGTSPDPDADYANVGDNPEGFALGGMPAGIQMPAHIAAANPSRPSATLPRRMGGLGLGSSMMGRRGFADGGSPDDGLGSRLDAATQAIADGTFDPQGADYTDFAPPLVKDDRKIAGLGEIPLPKTRPAQAGLAQAIAANTDSLPADDTTSAPFRLQGSYSDNPDNAVPISQRTAALNFAGADPDSGLPPQITNPGGNGVGMPPGVLAYGPGAKGSPLSLAPAGLGAAPDTSSAAPAGLGAAPDADASTASPGLLDKLRSLSPEAKMALLTFGLQTMASRSPFPAVAVGEGGLAGVKSYAEAQKANADAADKADQRGMEHKRVDIEVQRLQQAADAAKLEAANKGIGPDGKINQTYVDLQQKLSDLKEKDPEKVRLLAAAGIDPKSPEGKALLFPNENAEGKLVPAGGVLIKNGQPVFSNKAAANLDPETLTAMAGQYLAGDRTVLQNLGRGAQGAENIVALRSEITRQAREQGIDPRGVVDRFNEQAGALAGQRSIGTRSANISLAANEANNMIPIALKASEAVPRTQYVPINNAIQAVQKGTSSPELARFVAATNSLVNAYVRAVSPTGVPTDAMRQHAYDMLNTAQDHKAYLAVTQIMQDEMKAALQAPAQVKSELRAAGREQPQGATATPQNTTPSQSKPAMVQQNGHIYKLGPDGNYTAVQ